MLRRVLVAPLAIACVLSFAPLPASAQAPAVPSVPAASTPPASVAEYQGSSCLVGGVTAAAITLALSRGLFTVAASAAAGCAIGWLGSPHLLTLWRKLQ